MALAKIYNKNERTNYRKQIRITERRQSPLVGYHFDFLPFRISGLFRKFESGIYREQRDYNWSRFQAYRFRFHWFGHYAFRGNS